MKRSFSVMQPHSSAVKRIVGSQTTGTSLPVRSFTIFCPLNSRTEQKSKRFKNLAAFCACRLGSFDIPKLVDKAILDTLSGTKFNV